MKDHYLCYFHPHLILSFLIRSLLNSFLISDASAIYTSLSLPKKSKNFLISIFVLCVISVYLLLFLTSEYGTDRLSRNVGKKLPLLAA